MNTEQEDTIKIIIDTLVESSHLIKNNSRNDVIFNITKFAKTEFNIEILELEAEKILELIKNKISSKNLRLRNKVILQEIKKLLTRMEYTKKDLEKLGEMLELSGEIINAYMWCRHNLNEYIGKRIEEANDTIKNIKNEIKENLDSLKYDETYLVCERPSYRQSVIKSVKYFLDTGDNYFTVENKFDSKYSGDNYYINGEYYC